MVFVLAAISLGLLSGFHCIGMCGPIALALPIGGKSMLGKAVSILTYNSGRVLTYAVLGLIFGLIGQSFFLFGFQQILSVTLGILILIILLFPYLKPNFSSMHFSFINKLKNGIAKRFKRSDLSSLFMIGLLNGLLPCGMVYIAIAGAVTNGTVINSIVFMTVFGLATIPFMFGISYIGQLISINARNIIRKAQPIIIGITAVLLILRGLNLGINYISPKLNEQHSINEVSHKTIKCCHK